MKLVLMAFKMAMKQALTVGARIRAVRLVRVAQMGYRIKVKNQ